MQIEVADLKPQIALAMKKTGVTMDGIHKAIDEICGKLIPYLAEQGKEMTGPPYLAYMNANDDFSQFDIEWGFPVGESVPVSGECYMSQTCAGKAIVATHKGPYSELNTTYGAIMEYAKTHSLESTGVYYDYYLSDPDQTPESELLTQVVFPIK
ncbi:MAG: GyrI-like domain-containing protein [Oscillospiraceae bacterium]|nr:GyrI-like domain-containing protein [Oscillospiraceae bacterium]